MPDASWGRLTYHILLQLIGLYGIFYFVTEGLWWHLFAALFIMFLSQWTIYAHYHMGVCHRAWRFTYKYIDHFFSVVGIMMGMGAPIPWSIIHRAHHKYVDTPEDPHSPQQRGWFIIHFHGWPTPDLFNSKVHKKDLLTEYSHLIMFNSYFSVALTTVLGWLFVFSLFGIEGVLATCIGFGLSNMNLGFTNGWIHRLGDGVIDKPSLFWWSAIIGSPEAYYHKEHHEKPFKYSHTKSLWEWNARLVDLFVNIGLVKLNDKI